MRRRYRLRYEVHCPGYATIWYHPESRRWLDADAPDSPRGGYINVQRCRKFRRALRVARGIRDRFGAAYPAGEVVIARYFRKHGEAWCREFVERAIES